MGSLPAGVVTFCFTDIESSTKLFARLGPRFLVALEEHRAIVRQATTAHGGAEVKTEGDGFFLAFEDPASAVAACVDLQRGLAAHHWPDGAPIRVRVGLHLGEAVPSDGDYLAFAVHVAARIGAASNGGQIVISDELAKALDGAALAGVTLKDLGTHELKDVPPVRLHQVCHRDLPSTFPPLRAVGSSRGYLPSPPSTFVGRDDDVARLAGLLAFSRLVTVTGAGGVGKTRLAIEAARTFLGSVTDGVWFVDLAPVTEPDRVDEIVLEALGVVRDAQLTARSQLVGYLAEREVVVVLDNCEHLVAAASATVEAILSTSGGATILVTSREALGIAGEHAWRLHSLDPATGAALFLERARQVGADATLGTADHAAIARIVSRLDGIPLAIELAASRTRVLTPSQIAERLDDRFRLLTGGSRTALARQRTLEATVDWSHHLLETVEQSLFHHLAVFVGSFDLDAVAEVWDRDVIDTLDVLERLVDKSMVQVRLAGDTVRYHLLETIRHYAWGKLVDEDAALTAKERHRSCYRVRVAAAEQLLGPGEVAAAEALAAEDANVRAALVGALDDGDVASALEFAAWWWLFCAVTGRSLEAYELVGRVLDAVDDDTADGELLAQTRTGASHLCYILQEPNEDLARHSSWVVDRARRRGPGDQVRWYDAWAAFILAMSSGGMTTYEAELVDQARDWAKRSESPFVLCQVLMSEVNLRAAREGHVALVPAGEASVEVARRSGAASLLGYALQSFALRLIDVGEIDRAVAVAEEAVAAARRGPNVYFVIFALTNLGAARNVRGDPADLVESGLIEAARLAGDAGLAYPQAMAELELGILRAAERRFAEGHGHLETANGLLSGLASHRPEMFFAAAMVRHVDAELLQEEGRLAEATAVFAENVALADASGIAWVRALTQVSMGWAVLDSGDLDAAADHFSVAREVARAGDHALRGAQGVASALRGLAAVAFQRGDTDRAAELAGAASIVPAPHNLGSHFQWRRHVAVLDRVRASVSTNVFEAAYERGRATGLDVALG